MLKVTDAASAAPRLFADRRLHKGRVSEAPRRQDALIDSIHRATAEEWGRTMLSLTAELSDVLPAPLHRRTARAAQLPPLVLAVRRDEAGWAAYCQRRFTDFGMGMLSQRDMHDALADGDSARLLAHMRQWPVLLLFRTRMITCYPDRAATGPHFIP